MVKTYPCQNVPNQNVPSFGQNVPTFLVKTYPVHQNVPNLLVKTYPIYFFLIFNRYFYFFVEKKLFAHWSKRNQHLSQRKLLIYSSITIQKKYQNIPNMLVETYPKYFVQFKGFECLLHTIKMQLFLSYYDIFIIFVCLFVCFG